MSTGEATVEEKKPEEQKPEEQKPVEAKTDAATEDKKEGPAVSEKLQTILKTIEELTVLELADLVKALEDKFGVSAAAVVAVAAPAAAAGGGDGGAVEEKVAFDVILSEVGSKKIQVIKEVRAITGLGLKDAKELVESAPKAIKEGIKKEDADEIKSKIEAVGGTVELK